jgi:YMGG-like Gly-zipper
MKTNTAAAAGLLALIFVAAAASAQSLIIYPAKGQSQGQQNKDEGECQTWAKNSTGIDPLALAEQASQPAQAAQAPVGGERVRGAARGAAGGAVIGAIAGDAGKGAAIGAVGGTMVGGSRQRQAQRYNANAQQQASANQSANVKSQLATFNRAYSACLEGRGYTVK